MKRSIMVQIVWPTERPFTIRAVIDGELLTARDAADLVHLLNVTARFQVETCDDATFMRESATRAAGLAHSVRSDTPEHYIEDLHSAGVIQLIKREIVSGKLD
jgi:hypothetical protein